MASSAKSSKVRDVVPAVRNWFHRQERRSLVVLDSADNIDNADDASYIDLAYFLPDAPSVDNTITTRSRAQEMGTLEAVEIGEMEIEEAAALFYKYAKLNHKAGDTAKEVLQIVQELGCLALAIALAGSYVATTPHFSSDLRHYLPKYRERRQQLLAFKAQKHLHRYGESVLSTWETSFAAVARQSATSLKSKLPQVVFGLVFKDPELIDLCEEILRIRGVHAFMRIFTHKIREFCSALRAENLTETQRASIWFLRRFSASFAFDMCELVQPSTIRDGGQDKYKMKQIPAMKAGVEEYLQHRHRLVQIQRGAAAKEPKHENSGGETTGSESRITEDHAREKIHGDELDRNKIDDDIKEDALAFADDQSIASDDSDKPNNLPLINDTVSWLTQGIPFQNLRHNLSRYVRSPLEYVQEVLQSTLSAELCSATFHVEWEVMQYIKSELEEGQVLSSVLTVSGGIIDAEASPCLDYCNRTWPATGDLVIRVLQKAMQNGRHGKYTFLLRGYPALTFYVEESLSSSTTISCRIQAEDVAHLKENATIVVSGPRDNVIGIAQQLAWLSTAFRIPIEGRFARSEFILYKTGASDTFNLRLLKLRDIGETPKACWHPIFLNGVLAHGFPIRPRDGEVGVELPFEAMTYLAGIVGPVEYRGGPVLKGFSTIIFPKSPPLGEANSNKSVQWHLIYNHKRTLISLSLLAEEEGRALWSLSDFKFLAQGRNFLGCYKQIDIHLGTEGTAYDRIEFSQANPPGRKPVLSSFSLGFSTPKVGGPSISTFPKRMSLTREENSYEHMLSSGSTMPLILYDTSESDRRAWMVPALSVILHMIHIWVSLQKKIFPKMHIPDLPYAEAAWDIGPKALNVIYDNSRLQLYISKDDNEPFLLKDLVKRFWLDLERMLAAKQDHNSTNLLIGWDLLELVTGVPSKPLAKELGSGKFQGNWGGLASDPNMVVLLCRGLGEVIVPKTDTQKLCRMWKLVPKEKDYLTASVECIMQWSRRFSGPENCAKLGQTVFWEPAGEEEPFADCSHGDRAHCQRVQNLVKKCNRPQSTSGLERHGAIIFGPRHKKLQKPAGRRR